MAGEHVLIVEDENKIARLLKDYFVNSGYQVSILENGGKVESFVRQKNPDLILLDINLPGLDGLSVCRNIRMFSDIPIVFLTARVEEIDALLGLELGSDDYIRKPFRPREVVARVKAVLRRYKKAVDPSAKKIGVLVLEEDAHVVRINDRELALTPNEFGLLHAFIDRPDKVFSRAELVDRVQGYSFDGYERTIDTHIKNLRKKIGDKLPGRDIIKTVYGVGYKLNKSELTTRSLKTRLNPKQQV